MDDVKRKWLLEGIQNGFQILNTARAENSILSDIEIENYKSATAFENREKVEKQIASEVANGRYMIVDYKPRIVSAIGAIPKSDNTVRIIHDASRPEGNALNDFCDKESFHYSSLQDAIDMVTPNAFLAKVDLSQAFRTVRTHRSNFPFCGLKWTFAGHSAPTYMVDTRLPNGARHSPFVFNELTQAVVRIMRARGFHNIVCYLDDFLISEQMYDKCISTLNSLISLLRELGFSINYNKVLGPTKRLTFLGIVLNTDTMKLELPEDKIKALKNTMIDLQSKSRATKCQLQSLIGKLNFATQCVFGGRFFLRRLHDAVGRLRLPWHRTRVTRAMQGDMQWWIHYLEEFSGMIDMLDPRPRTPIYTDACLLACGAVYEDQYVYLRWEDWPITQNVHINHKETLAFEVALTHWAEQLRNSKVIIHCDNTTAVAVMNRGSSRNQLVMASLRRIFWLSAKYNFRLETIYHPGKRNILADNTSRMHEGQHIWRDSGLFPVQLSHFCFEKLAQGRQEDSFWKNESSILAPWSATKIPTELSSSVTKPEKPPFLPQGTLYAGTLCSSLTSSATALSKNT